MKRKPKVSVRGKQRHHQPIAGILCFYIIALLSSCNLIPDVGPGNTATTPTPTPIARIAAHHQSYRRIEVWLQATADYPYQVLHRAASRLGDAIDQAVQPDSEGMDVLVSLITSNSYAPENLIETIHIPAIPADAMTPTLLPDPTPTDQGPYHDADAKQQVDSENANRLALYQQQLAENHALLAHIRAEVRAKTDVLRNLHPAVDTGTPDFWGALNRASQHLAGGRGEKFLFIAGNLQQTSWNEFVPGLTVYGVHVRVIYHYCTDAAACGDSETFWRGAFIHAHAADVKIFDVGKSDEIDNLLS
jgi:hypothetical protein